MKVPYVDQSALGLRFYLIVGEVNVEQYTVLAQKKLNWDNLDVEMGILGASHFIRIDTPQGLLNEIFACAKISTDFPQIQAGPLSDLPVKVETVFGGLHYSFTPRLVEWEEGEEELRELTALVREAKNDSTKIGLSFTFPTGTQSNHLPLTLVWGSMELSTLTVKTLHSYPNEEQLVFTTTIIERGKKQ